MIQKDQSSQFAVYKAGKRTYLQYPLVDGQMLEVLKIIKGLFFPNATTGETIEPAQGKGSKSIDPGKIIDMLTGESLYHFLGVVLLEEGQQPEDLALVRSYVERGKKIIFNLKGGQANEVVQDFFDLNLEAIDEVLKMFGVKREDMVGEMSSALKELFSETLNSSANDGGSTPKS